jgi:hypothetical protein
MFQMRTSKPEKERSISMNFTVYLNDDLAEKVNSRLRRDVKISVLCRWLLMSVVMTPKELEEICFQNEDEARSVGPFLWEAIDKLRTTGQKITEAK